MEKTVRRTVVTAVTLDGEKVEAEVPDPLGSPQHPFAEEDLEAKLIRAKGEAWTRKLLDKMADWPRGNLGEILPLLYNEERE